ncbi:MAG: GNAT family protein [Patescibacteria group bacterium]
MVGFLLNKQKCVLFHMRSTAVVDAIIERHAGFLGDPEVTRFLRVKDASVEYQRQKILDVVSSPFQCAMAVLLGTEECDLRSIASRYIGMATLRDIDAYNFSAHSGSMIGDKSLWRMGFGKEAKLLQLYYAFMGLRLRWVFSRTIRSNIASIRMLESAGYVQQGLRPDCRRVGNDFYDELLFGANRERWRAVWNERALTRV